MKRDPTGCARLCAMSGCRENEANLHFHALPERGRALVVPCVHDACSHMFSCAKISFDGLMSGVADIRLGDISSMLVALRILMASSDSCL
jgi:hypothetical protein